MFSNLFKNCIEASPHDSQISIHIKVKNSKSMSISFHNFSVVPKEIRNRFFSKLSTHGKKNGTGLGNYSAMLIAKTLGGVIEKGTFVTVTF
ncbi:MAG: ATP-binding protein [Spirochaetia bacterium]|nr:ATP-binding protein [Spirochaetia bacterium]